MPTYEYACKSCGEHLEVVQSFKDEPLAECPHCHGPLRKVFGNIGIAFKGSGFYKNDSRAASSTAKSAESKAGSGGSKSGGSKSGESKSGESKSGGGESKSGGGESSGSSSGSAASSEAKAS